MFSRISTILKSNKSLGVQAVRNSHHWNYRAGRTPPAKNELVADIIAGFAWWWVLWHLVTEPGHITGEFAYPDASKWTNAELGIPDN